MNHSRACLAKSMFAAIENFRDADMISDTEFYAAAGRDILSTAEGYLADGLMTCICKIFDRTGDEITNPYYRDRWTGELAVVTTTGITYRDTPSEG